MARLILLDSGPLGLIVRAPQAASRSLHDVAQGHLGKRRDRHHPRDRPLRSPSRTLEHYLDPRGGLRHLTLTTESMIKAAEFWDLLRQLGIPTASPDALNADAILPAKRRSPGRLGTPSPSRRRTWCT